MRIPARLRRVSKKGVLLIARFEGYSAKPYNDPVGYATIGYGHLIRYGGVRPSDKPITHDQALALLRKDVKTKAANGVRIALAKAKYRPTQAEFDALVSFAFNLGPGMLTGDHTIARAIRTRNRHAIADAIVLYDKAAGKTLEGLTRRRQAERRLFLTGKYA